MKVKSFGLASLGLGAMVLLAACSSNPSPKTTGEKMNLDAEATGAVNDFKERDPSMASLFTTSYGYAIFPDVASGALIVGGAHGYGEVFQGSKKVGYSDLTQASVGFQAGGQSFAEVVFFQDEASFTKFTTQPLEFDARATAVAASRGAASTANYSNGVLVFTTPNGGLMAAAAIGGQKFRFRTTPPQ